jgi:hypothetical protein
MELGHALFGNSTSFGHKVDRGFQDQFCDFLKEIGLDGYGSDGTGKGFENDVFAVRPYYWGECENDVDDCDCEHCKRLALPNFEFKPTEFCMDWYKYPLRDAYSNVGLTSKMLRDMIHECLKSVGK